MKIDLVERDTFLVCGYSTETTAAHNDKDISELYKDFFEHGKEAALLKMKGCKKGCYGLSWYTHKHEHYCYLLGKEVEQTDAIPDDALLKKVEKTTYAVAHFQKGEDIIKAWTDFFYHEIPEAGFQVNEEPNLYFEYYPGPVNAEYELWVPVVKAPTILSHIPLP